MKKYAFLLATALLNAHPCLPAAAQTVQSIGDCGKARDPARCLALQQAHAECRDKHGRDKHLCVSARLPPPDCRKAVDPLHCETRVKAPTKLP